MNGVDPFHQLLFEVLSGARFMAIAALMAAVPVSLGVLAVFRRRILRSVAPSTSPTPKIEKQDAAPAASDPASRSPIAWQQLHQVATSHRAGLARMYILGGIGLAVALAVVDAIMNAGAGSFSPLRFLFSAICFSTPLALTIRLLYGRWKPGVTLIGFQLIAAFVFTRFVPQIGDDAAGTAVTASLLMAVLLHPRIRAAGPLATGFFTVVFTGALLSVAGSIFFMRDSIQTNILTDPRVATLKDLVAAKDEVNARAAMFVLTGDWSFWRDQGLFVLQTIAVLALVGIAASLVLGSLLFFRVTKAYARKRVSDQFLVIASVWLFLAIAVASVLSPYGVWANLACVAVFGLAMAAGWRRVSRYEGPGVRLLLLRSFTLGERSNRLFQDLESLWRSIGSIQLVGAVDLALTTLEPHELLDFVRGRSRREFVHSEDDVNARLASFDHARDPDGRFRVNVIFCAGDTIWKYAVTRMLIDSDCVLMDLRGFSRHRAGCVFEIRSLAESDLPFRTVFLVDESTDRDYVRETWAAAAKSPLRNVIGDAFEFVSELPSNGAVPERIVAAFSGAQSGHSGRNP